MEVLVQRRSKELPRVDLPHSCVNKRIRKDPWVRQEHPQIVACQCDNRIALDGLIAGLMSPM